MRRPRLYYTVRNLRGVPWRTRRAMFAYWLSGELGWIRWPQRYYTIDYSDWDWEGEPPAAVRGPREWRRPAPFVLKLMLWAMHHDPAHSDHWALDRRNSRWSFECPVCKGTDLAIPLGPGMRDWRGEDDSVHPEAT